MSSVKWRVLDVPADPKSEKFKLVVRLNSLGSLYFFEKFTLGRNKMSPTFHKPILDRLESDVPRYLIELPRDHFKTTMVTEGRSIWQALPFTDTDEVCMRDLGYGDEWISWMRRIHDPNRRILTVSETIGNAIKIGKRIDWHFTENSVFRHIFSDILPTSKCTWNDESKQILSASRGPCGEGTFDYLGVGAALQSRHYTDVTEDDVIGKDAIESDLVMEKSVDYHKLLIGAFESFHAGHWTVVNNRWAPNDLSGWIRAHDPSFQIEHHSALGGCGEGCHDNHAEGQPVFPEEFSLEDLLQIQKIQGPYFFSHQYLNLPINPEECIFQKEWLRFYGPIKSPTAPDRQWLRHEVRDGEVIPDINPNVLIRSMVVDPNHAEEKGRARHAIVVTGFDPETDRVYLLDVWARSASYDALVHNIFELAKLWNLHECWIEAIAGQRLLRYPIEVKRKSTGYNLNPRFDLKTDKGANAKRDRIESLETVFRNGQLWARRDQTEFLNEYYAYPGYPTKDVLDCLGYAPQTWNAIHARRIMEVVRARKERWSTRKTTTGY